MYLTAKFQVTYFMFFIIKILQLFLKIAYGAFLSLQHFFLDVTWHIIDENCGSGSALKNKQNIIQSTKVAMTSILSPEADILLVKWVVHVGSTISSGSILCSYKICGDEKVLRLKSEKNCGIVRELLFQEGQKVTSR